MTEATEKKPTMGTEDGIVPEDVPEFRLFNNISCRWPSPAKRKRLNKEIEKRMAKEEWKKK